MQIIRVYNPFFAKNLDLEAISDVEKGETVILKNSDNFFYGKVIFTREKSEGLETEEEFQFVRVANRPDLEKIESFEKKEKDYLEIFREEHQKAKLELDPISCSVSFDEKMTLFTFAAENRVDFRELLKTLAGKIRKRIQLKHIGARDRAVLIGGVGVCGKELCCSKFLKDLKSVTIEAVKSQDLIYKNTEALSGLCGKLKCCLNYEVNQYKELKKSMPKIGTGIKMEDGNKGVVIGMDVFNQKLKIKTDNRLKIIDYSEFKELKAKNGN